MMLAAGGGPLNCQSPPVPDSGSAVAVVATNPAALTTEPGPKKNPAWFINTMMPLAFRCPQICDGFESLILFQTMEAADGCRKVVVSPGAILKDCHVKKALSEVVIVRLFPFAV